MNSFSHSKENEIRGKEAVTFDVSLNNMNMFLNLAFKALKNKMAPRKLASMIASFSRRGSSLIPHVWIFSELKCQGEVNEG